MKKKFWIIALVGGILGGGYIIILFGSGLLYNGIEIIGLKSGKRFFIQSEEYRKVVIGVNEKKREFSCIFQKNEKIQLEKYDFKGKLLNTKIIPFFSRNYYYKTNNMSPDGKYIAYFDRPSLCILNLETDTIKKLIGNFASSTVTFNKMTFISNEQVLLVYENKKKTDEYIEEVVLYNIKDRKKELFYQTSYIEKFSCYISRDKSKFVFATKNNIVVLDLKNRKKNRKIKREKNKTSTYIQNLCISPDNDILVYAQKGSMYLYDLRTDKTRTLMTYNPKEICYELDFVTNSTIIYECGIPGSNIGRHKLNIFDINLKKVIKVVNVNINGSLYVVDNGEKLIVEVN